MRDVKLVSLSEDGSYLVLRHDDTTEQFALAIDDRLRSAVVSDRARAGQLPLEVASRLRPKEIQARVRAGESSEDIAAAAGVPLERILRYAGPVLAEREHIAGQARRCAVRSHGHEGPGAILEQMVENRLRVRGIPLDTLGWDAWRSESGRWTVVAQYHLDGTGQVATFSFDPAGRVVVPADDMARTLTGDATDQRRSAPSPSAQQQRSWLAAVPDDPDRDRASSPDPDAEDTVDLSWVNRADRSSASQENGELTRPSIGPDELADLDDGEPRTRPEAGSTPHDATDRPEPTPDAPPEQPAADRSVRPAAYAAGSTGGRSEYRPPQGRRRRRSKRAVVPSWDEILFGAGGAQSD